MEHITLGSLSILHAVFDLGLYLTPASIASKTTARATVPCDVVSFRYSQLTWCPRSHCCWFHCCRSPGGVALPQSRELVKIFRGVSFSLWRPPVGASITTLRSHLGTIRKELEVAPACIPGHWVRMVTGFSRLSLAEKTRGPAGWDVWGNVSRSWFSASSAVCWERGWWLSFLAPNVPLHNVSGESDLKMEPLAALQEWIYLIAGGGCLMRLILNPKEGISTNEGGWWKVWE